MSEKAGPAEGTTVSVSAQQAEDLRTALALAKALASPHRLAILGELAARLPGGLTLDELARSGTQSPVQVERDVRQLAEAGLALIDEWSAAAPGREPRPARIVFNRDYMKAMSQVIATLNRLGQQVRPAEQAGPADERSRTLSHFMHNGRLLGFPTQHRLQLYVLEEVATAFEPGRDYTEREVDAILKDVYEYDHCTLRRSLVDTHLLDRANGIYTKVERAT
ncbi:MAG: DUF2087 domain-containing protein [Chloroflexia bacterium]